MTILSQEEALFNGRIKLYPDQNGGERIAQVLLCSRPVFNPLHLECVRGKSPKPRSRITDDARALWDAEAASAAMGDRWEKEISDSEKRAKRRARQRVYDLAACNSFDLFITLTLDAAQIDRYDYKPVVRKMGQWLDNRVRRQGLRYLMVPELHKDGALHFHGLINSEAVKLVDSGRRYKDGRAIYNLPEWSLGFTTAMRLMGNYDAVCAYICKYITKQNGNTDVRQGSDFSTKQSGSIGGRYYFSGGNLRGPRFEYFRADYAAAAAEQEFEVADGRVSFKVLSNKRST